MEIPDRTCSGLATRAPALKNLGQPASQVSYFLVVTAMIAINSFTMKVLLRRVSEAFYSEVDFTNIVRSVLMQSSCHRKVVASTDSI